MGFLIDFLIDILIGVALLVLCYIIFVIIVKLPELAEIKSKVGVQAKKIYKILNYTLIIFLAINVIVGVVSAIILLISWFI